MRVPKSALKRAQVEVVLVGDKRNNTQMDV